MKKLFLILLVYFITTKSFASTPMSEKDILDIGPIEPTPYLGGATVGTLFGLGIGHAVQGRYGSKAAFISATEALGYILVLSGGKNCTFLTFPFSCTLENQTARIGAITFVLARVLELFDLWVGAPQHNSEYERLQMKQNEEEALNFFISPVANNEGLGAAAALQFRF